MEEQRRHKMPVPAWISPRGKIRSTPAVMFLAEKSRKDARKRSDNGQNDVLAVHAMVTSGGSKAHDNATEGVPLHHMYNIQ